TFRPVCGVGGIGTFLITVLGLGASEELDMPIAEGVVGTIGVAARRAVPVVVGGTIGDIAAAPGFDAAGVVGSQQYLVGGLGDRRQGADRMALSGPGFRTGRQGPPGAGDGPVDPIGGQRIGSDRR